MNYEEKGMKREKNCAARKSLHVCVRTCACVCVCMCICVCPSVISYVRK